jgi:uncharacterized protein (DUF1778 family)
MNSTEKFWKLPTEVYEEFVDALEPYNEDLPKLTKLFNKARPFTSECE